MSSIAPKFYEEASGALGVYEDPESGVLYHDGQGIVSPVEGCGSSSAQESLFYKLYKISRKPYELVDHGHDELVEKGLVGQNKWGGNHLTSKGQDILRYLDDKLSPSVKAFYTVPVDRAPLKGHVQVGSWHYYDD